MRPGCSKRIGDPRCRVWRKSRWVAAKVVVKVVVKAAVKAVVKRLCRGHSGRLPYQRKGQILASQAPRMTNSGKHLQAYKTTVVKRSALLSRPGRFCGAPGHPAAN